MSPRLVGRSFALLGVASALALACTTEVSFGNPLSFGRSKLLGATRQPVARVLTTSDTVFWLESGGGIFSCPKAGCDGTPTIVTRASGAVATSNSVTTPLPATISGGYLYFAAGQQVRRCALSGCAEPETLVTGPSEIVRISVEGTSIAWATANDGISTCNVDNCQPRSARLGCTVDTECGPDKPICGSNGECVPCGDNLTKRGVCKGATAVCGSDQSCVGCDLLVSTAGTRFGCTQPTSPVCDGRTRSCVRCASSTDCDVGNGRGQACVNKACVKCDGDYASDTAAPCSPAQPVCDLAAGTCGACNPATCTAPNQCASTGCLAPCLTPDECGVTFACLQGFCAPKLPQGAVCQGNASCFAGACTSGKCGRALGADCATDADCAADLCGADKKCGAPVGGACFVQGQCRTGSCFGRICGAAAPASTSPKPVAESIVLSGGRLYFSQTSPSPGAPSSSSTSIYSCALAECPAGITPVGPSDAAFPKLLVAGDARSLFFLAPRARGGFPSPLFLYRCELPSCASPTNLETEAIAAPVIEGDDLFVVANAGALRQCSRSGCADSKFIPLPDPALASSNGDSTVTLAGHPFAVDSANFYWATSSLFGEPGNLVVASPR